MLRARLYRIDRFTQRRNLRFDLLRRHQEVRERRPGVENLMPLYSGGLCEAVKLIAPPVLRRITSHEIAGVGAASLITSGVTPCAARMSGSRFYKCFAEKTRIAPDDERGIRVLLRDITCDAGNCAAHIGESKFLGDNRAPA